MLIIFILIWSAANSLDDDDDDDIYFEYYSGKGFQINYSVYMSYVKHINLSNKA
jgi:hypothetical protein